MSDPRIAAVVLGAGRSLRLGQPKQLVEVEGQPLLRRTVQTVANSEVDAVFVTLPTDNAAFSSALEGLQWSRIVVEHPELGQSESIRAGLQTVEHQGDFDAILFTPCDLLFLATAHLNVLIEQYKSGSWDAVASRYADALGAPLIMGRRLWPAIHTLRGDTGARKILNAHPETIVSIAWEEGCFDLDTPADLEALRARQ